MSIRRHTFYNLVGQMAPLVVALATIPVFLQLIGEARYGVLVLVWLLVGYLGLFDLGLGPATAQRMAREGAGAEHRQRRADLFWTAVALSLGVGIVGALVAWPVAAHLFGGGLSIEASMRSEVLSALPWIALTVPVTTVCAALGGALQARHQFLELNIVNALGQIGAQVLPLLVAQQLGSNLSGLVLAVFAARLATMLALLVLCVRGVVDGLAPRWSMVAAADLLRFGGWVTVTAVVGPLMVVLDRFVIGALFGAKAVGQYTIPFQLAERVTVLSSALNAALLPRLAADAPQRGSQALGQEALRALAVVLSPIIAACVLLVEPFLAWWLSAEFAAAAAPAARLLFVGFWINSLALVPFTELQARGRPDLVAKCHAAELLPYLLVLYAALAAFGLPGAAAAFGLRAAVDFVLLSHLAGRLGGALRLLWPPALMLAAALLPGGWAQLSLAGQWLVGLVAFSGTVMWSIGSAPPSLRALVSRAS
jgi:O-antigen/teichoic acid export membrane protein